MNGGRSEILTDHKISIPQSFSYILLHIQSEEVVAQGTNINKSDRKQSPVMISTKVKVFTEIMITL